MEMYFDERDTLRQNIGNLSERDRNFAESLLSQARRGLSTKQEHWLKELMRRATEPKREAETIASFAGVVALLDKAAENLKHPKLLVRVDGQDYQLSIARLRSSAPGSINVTDARRAYADRTWFGRVTRDGKFEPSQKITGETATAISAALTALAKDPAAVASEYGRMTGSCCFCGLELTDARSIHVGYGKICATKWALPWGSK